ncbi:MAG: 5-formyltetrahydrofolate cyclo-ligase [Pseudomonadota bacterium]
MVPDLAQKSKHEMRQILREIRAEAAARDPDAAEKLADIFPMKLFDRYGPIVAGYVPIRDELSPLPLMDRLALAGAALCLPRVNADETMDFRLWEPGEPLEEGPFGLKEPPTTAPIAYPSLVLVPALGFDAAGTRLGYGSGHYDRALSALRGRGRAFACVVAYKAQMLEDLPVEAHDEPLDWAVTEQGSVPLFMMRAMAS